MVLGPYHTYRFAGFRNSLDSHIYFLNHTKISGYRESSSCLAHLTFNVLKKVGYKKGNLNGIVYYILIKVF